MENNFFANFLTQTIEIGIIFDTWIPEKSFHSFYLYNLLLSLEYFIEKYFEYENIDWTISLAYWIYDDTHMCEFVRSNQLLPPQNVSNIQLLQISQKRSHCINNWPGILIINMPHNKLLLVNFMHTIKYGMLFFCCPLICLTWQVVFLLHVFISQIDFISDHRKKVLNLSTYCANEKIWDQKDNGRANYMKTRFNVNSIYIKISYVLE